MTGGVGVTVPHAGPGSHTLVVAVEVDDDLLADPAASQRIVARVTVLARRALTQLDVAPPGAA